MTDRQSKGALGQVWAVLTKDLLIERRAWTRVVALMSFAVLVLLLFSFAVGPDTKILQKHAAGYLWLATLFASTTLFTQSFSVETESGALAQLQLAPVLPGALFYGKALANALQLFVLLVISLPPLIALCDVSFVEGLDVLLLTCGLGALGIAAPGAMYAAMTARISSQQMLLPLLLFPLIVPAMLSAVKATSLILGGDPMDQLGSWLSLLTAFDVVFWALCGVMFGRITET